MKKLLVFVAAFAMMFVSCKKGTINLSSESVTLNKGQEYSIQASSDKSITYATSNEYHASVNDKGVVTANFVGSTNIKITTENDSKEFRVNVAPVSKLYEEPEFNFGMRESAVIEKYGEPYLSQVDGNVTLLAYLTDNEQVPLLIIEIEDGCVVAYCVEGQYSTSYMELATFIEERYNFVESYNGYKYYVNGLEPKDVTLMIGKFWDIEADIFEVIYVEYSNYKNDVAKMMSDFAKKGAKIVLERK